jgi:hypothetical protein
MTCIVFTFLIAVALCSSSWAADEETIEAKDAAQHVGETLVVHGTIADVHQFKGGSIVLNINQTFTTFHIIEKHLLIL